VAQALALAGGDRELLRLMLDSCPGDLAALGEAIRRGDPGALCSAAHKFLGQVGAFSASAQQAIKLFEAIERVAAREGPEPEVEEREPEREAGPAEHAGFDVAQALALAGGDRELLRLMIDLFLDSCPGDLAALGEAIRRGDPGALRSAAHKFLGQVGAFSASAQQATRQLHQMAQAGTLDEAEAVYAGLEGQVEGLQAALRCWLATGKTEN
jgi:HPt (histidine-containing phosphotransfer) domain-containing protein